MCSIFSILQKLFKNIEGRNNYVSKESITGFHVKQGEKTSSKCLQKNWQKTKRFFHLGILENLLKNTVGRKYYFFKELISGFYAKGNLRKLVIILDFQVKGNFKKFVRILRFQVIGNS